MRKITKSLLTLALLMLAVGGANSVKAEKFVSLGSVLTLAEAEAASTSGTGVAIVYDNSKLFANATGGSPTMSLVDVSKATRGYMFKLSKKVVADEVQYYRIQCYNPNSTLIAAGEDAGAYGGNILSTVSWGDAWASTVDAERESEEWDGRDFKFGAQWCFESDGAGGYYIKTRSVGSEKPYLSSSGNMTNEAGKASYKFYSLVEIAPYTLKWTPNAGTYRATIPLSESYIRTIGDVSINYSTGEVTNTGSGKLIIYLNNENLVGATGYNLKTAGDGLLGSSLDITDAVNGEVGGIYTSRNSWYIAGDGSRKDKIGAIKAFTYNFSGGAGSQTITSIYFDADLLVAQTATKNLTSMPYGEWTAPASTLGTYISDDAYKTNNIGSTTNGVIFGHENNSDKCKYVDLTYCSKMTFTGSSANGGIRFFYNWDGTNDVKPIEIINDFPTTNGTYVFDIDAFKKAKGITFFHLIGIKSLNSGNVSISSVTVDEYTNVISGSGINKAKDYLLNPYITSIDATGVTAATALSAANPNCLISANAGKITNANNVIVSGTCANLELTDGYPFKAPADFTATSASYTTTINTTAKAGTLCLPFAATIPVGVEAWTLNYTAGKEAVKATEVTTTIPANTPVLLNGNGSADFTGSSVDIDADATNVSGALTGVFNATTVPENSYVLQNGTNGIGFYKVKSDNIVANPFRAYLTADGLGAPSLRIIFPEDGDVTGISEIEKMKNAENVTIFDLQGRKVAQPQKGLYIVNGKKIIFK